MRLKNLKQLLKVGDKIEGYSHKEIDEAEKRLNIKFPEALREIYYRFGKNGILNGCNYLIPPKHIPHWNGFLTFYMENQGVCHWFLKLDEWAKGETNIYVTDEDGYNTFVTKNMEVFFIKQSIQNNPNQRKFMRRVLRYEEELIEKRALKQFQNNTAQQIDENQLSSNTIDFDDDLPF